MRKAHNYLHRIYNDYTAGAFVVIFALLLAMTWLMCWLPAENWPDHFRSRFLRPAIAAACGKGLILYDENESPELTAFLNGEKAFLLPSELPDEFVTRSDLDPFSKAHVYLLWSVSLIWRLCGITWQSVYVLHALLFAITALAAYGLLRLGMPRTPAVFFTLLFLISPGVLSVLPNLRDFSKAPFMLIALFFMGLLVRKRMRGPWICATAAILGLVEGFGLGFRTDLLISVLPGILVLLFFSRPSGRYHIGIRIVAVVINLTVFFMAGQPVLEKMREDAGGEASHNITGGFGENVLSDMGLQPASYQLLQRMDDREIHAVVASYGVRVHQLPMPREFLGPESGMSGRKFIRHVFQTFPGDIISRGWASMLYVCGGAEPDRVLFPNTFLNRMAALVRPPARHLDSWKLFYLTASLLILAAYRLRLACALFLALVYFGGYPSLQFQHRHAFHLSLVAFWLCGFTLSTLLLMLYHFSTAREWRRNILESPRTHIIPPLKRAALFGALALAFILIPFYSARCWQYFQVKDLLNAYNNARMTPLNTEPLKQNDKVLHALRDKLPGFIGPEEVLPYQRLMEVHTAYLAFEFEAHRNSTPVTIEYHPAAGNPGLTQTIYARADVREGPVRTTLFFPVYQYGVDNGCGGVQMTQFAGVSLSDSSEAGPCRLSRVLNMDDFPFLLTLALQENMAGFRYWHALDFQYATLRRNIDRALADHDYTTAVRCLRRVLPEAEETRRDLETKLIYALVKQGEGYLRQARDKKDERFRYRALDVFSEACSLQPVQENYAGVALRKTLEGFGNRLIHAGKYQEVARLLKYIPEENLSEGERKKITAAFLRQNQSEKAVTDIFREALASLP